MKGLINMKKTKTVLILFTFLFALVLLAGCSSLEAPRNIELNNRLLTWNEVKGAVGYKVKINDIEYETEQNEFVLPEDLFGKITVSVKVLGKNKETAYGPCDDFTAVLVLPAPVNIRQTGNKIVWDEVPDATGYVISVNGIEHLSLENEFSIEQIGAAEVRILATGRSDGLIVSSQYSDVFVVKATLDSPENIVSDNGIISWDEVENADRYVVIINDTDERETAVPSLSLKYQYAGSVNLKIKAGGSDDYSDSDFTETTLDLPILTMPAPKNIAVSNGILTFDSVAYAGGYEIYANGLLLATTTETTYTIPLEIINQDGSYIQVKTLSDLYYSSELSYPIICNTVSIATEEELRNISAYGSYVLENDITLTEPWLPPAQFSGMFDGNGYTINGLMITVNQNDIGFFGELSAAIVRNLTLEGIIDVNCNLSDSNVGGLAGKITKSEISNVNIVFDIVAVSNNGVGNSGGIAGIIEQSNFKNVTFAGSMTTEHFITGGFVGKARNPETAVKIECSSVTAVIGVTGGEQSAAGGFIGMMTDNSLTITESYARVTLNGPSYVGGFVGYLGSGRINNCYADGSAESTGTLVHIGGFIGRLEGYNSKVVNCLARVAVAAENTGANVYCGGFTGKTLGGTYAFVYDNCYYDNTVAPIDRIGNPESGIGDGITARNTEELQENIPGFSTDIWVFAAGENPKLKWQDLLF